MESLSRRLSSYRSMHNSGENTTGHRNTGDGFGPKRSTIMPVPREELPDEMRSVLESFISSRRPSLADIRLAHADADIHHTTTIARSQSQGSPTRGHERYDYDGVHGPSSNWPFDFALKGKRFPSGVYHTHKVVPRSRPNAKEQLGRRRWNPSRRHGRIFRKEDYDAYAAREHAQTREFLNSESLLNLSIRGGRTVKGIVGKAVDRGGLSGWPCSWTSKLGRVTRIFRRG